MPTLPHRAHLATVFCPAPREGHEPPFGLPPPPHPRSGGLREASRGLGVRLRLRERIADASCSATTLRDRRDEWIELGVMEKLRGVALDAYDDRLIGLELSEVAVDGCITKVPCGGEKAGRSSVDRGKMGLKRSMAVDAVGVPMGTVSAPANRRDSPLLVPTLEAVLETLGGLPEETSVHLDRGYDSGPTRERLANLGLRWEISGKGKPAPLWPTRRWVVERTNS